MLMLNFMLG